MVWGHWRTGVGQCPTQQRETAQDIFWLDEPWGPLAQPPSKCWSGLCPRTAVPPVLRSSVGKALQGAWDRIWQEAKRVPTDHGHFQGYGWARPSSRFPVFGEGGAGRWGDSLSKSGLGMKVFTEHPSHVGGKVRVKKERDKADEAQRRERGQKRAVERREDKRARQAQAVRGDTERE